MQDIQAIVFDFGNVLDVPDDWAVWEAQRDQLVARFRMESGEFWQHLFGSEAWQRAKLGQMSEEAFFADRLTLVGMTDPGEQRAFVKALFAGRQVNNTMRDLLKQLRTQGRHKLAVLSNTAIRNMAEWLATEQDLPCMFDEVVASADVGLAKPDAAIYELLLARLECAPHQVLFIDDQQRNTDAAAALGIQTHLFESSPALMAELIAHQILDGDPSNKQ